jgi:hypothetical protein
MHIAVTSSADLPTIDESREVSVNGSAPAEPVSRFAQWQEAIED